MQDSSLIPAGCVFATLISHRPDTHLHALARDAPRRRAPLHRPTTLRVQLPSLHVPRRCQPLRVLALHVGCVPAPRRQCLSCRQQVHYYTKQTISVGVYGRIILSVIKVVRLYTLGFKVQNDLRVSEERALLVICRDQVGLLTRLRLT